MAHNADTNVVVEADRYTALLSAVVCGKPDAVQLLLDSNVDTSTLLGHDEFKHQCIAYPRISCVSYEYYWSPVWTSQRILLVFKALAVQF